MCETLAYGYFQLGLSGFDMDGCGVKEKSKVILRVLAQATKKRNESHQDQVHLFRYLPILPIRKELSRGKILHYKEHEAEFTYHEFW